MTKRVHFLSDLHLCAERPELTTAFVDRYLGDLPDDLESIYILGDLFDAWVGDDDDSSPRPEVRYALKETSLKGIKVSMIVGNRDFLIGSRFADYTGINLLPDYHIIDLFGTRTLLTHGDLLCTDDIEYQQFRTLSHQADWQAQFLSQPLETRKAVAQQYRMQSAEHKNQTAAAIMDVNQDTVEQIMRQFGVRRMIHGHTHRPAVHAFELDDEAAQRYVLPEWGSCGKVMEWQASGHRLLII